VQRVDPQCPLGHLAGRDAVVRREVLLRLRHGRRKGRSPQATPFQREPVVERGRIREGEALHELRVNQRRARGEHVDGEPTALERHRVTARQDARGAEPGTEPAQRLIQRVPRAGHVLFRPEERLKVRACPREVGRQREVDQQTKVLVPEHVGWGRPAVDDDRRRTEEVQFQRGKGIHPVESC